MAILRIRRVAQNRYALWEYDPVLSVNLGEMSEETLEGHLLCRDLVNYTAFDVLHFLEVHNEINVKFRASLWSGE